MTDIDDVKRVGEAMDVNIRSMVGQIPEMRRQLKWMVHKCKTATGAKKEREKAKLDKWLIKHFWLKGEARRLMEGE